MDLHPYAQAFADRDHAATVAMLSDDVIFHSPVIGEQAFHGKAATAALFEIAFREIEVERYTHGWRDGSGALTVADARVRGKSVKVTNLLEFDADGRIREIWVMARPLIGLVAIAEAIGDGLSRLEAPRRAAVLAITLKPFVAMAALIDRIGSGLIRSLNRSVTRSPR